MTLRRRSKKKRRKGPAPIVLKSPREIGKLREAGLVNWRAHELVAEMIRPGVSTAEIDAAVERFFADEGVEPLFKGVPGESYPFPAVCCMSVNEAVVHGIPNDIPLQPGDILSVDTGNRKGGWCGDSARTHAIGEIPAKTRKLLEVTKQALLLSIELAGRCRRWSEVAAASADYVRGEGFSVVEELSGHGLGRGMHEPPSVPNYVDEDFLTRGDFELRTGLVIAIEPMVNQGGREVGVLEDEWTIVTEDGAPSAHFEHTIALTPDGVLVLTAGPDGEL